MTDKKLTWNDDRTWVSDRYGNRCSVSYFGSEGEAEAAIRSLIKCRNCINCSDCSGCSGCSYCSDCSYCSYCSGKEGDFRIPSVPDLADLISVAVDHEDFNMATWEHDCGTPACLAGHIVHAAGADGLALKDKTSWPFAGMAIAKASGLNIPPTWFYGDTDKAKERVRSLIQDKSNNEKTS